MPTVVMTFGSYSLEIEDLRIEGGQRLAEVIIPGRDGAVVQSSPPEEPVSIGMRGRLFGTSATALRTTKDALAAALRGGRQQLKIFDDRYMYATMRRKGFSHSTQSGSLLVVDFFVDFLADVPFFEAVSLSTDSGSTTWTPTLSGGGNAASPPKFTITAPAGGLTAATIANTTSSKTFSWTGSLSSGKTLVVDMAAQTVVEDGAENYAGFSGDFWDLAAGSNNVSVTTTDTAASVSVEWRSRWYH